MAYVLEKITAEDQERIIGDAAQIPRRQHDLIYARDQNEGFPMAWAIDRERNCYMIQLYSLVRDPWVATYLLFFNRTVYVAFSDSVFARRMYLDDVPRPPAELVEDVKREFTAALEVYGMYGNGPLDKDGKANEVVMPAFFEKPKGDPWL